MAELGLLAKANSVIADATGTIRLIMLSLEDTIATVTKGLVRDTDK